MASARAMATRCCWPPESCAGWKSTRSPSPTASSCFTAIFSASAFERPSTLRGASMTLPSAVRCGNRLNCWNTMPMCSRTLFTSTPGAVMSSPSKKILPAVGFSSRFTQRRSVDLPEPLGPRIATTSPRWTSRSTPFKTSREPNDLTSPSSRTTGSVVVFCAIGVSTSIYLDACSAAVGTADLGSAAAFHTNRPRFFLSFPASPDPPSERASLFSKFATNLMSGSVTSM